MALLWIEGFEGYGTGDVTAQLRRRYQYIVCGSPYWYTTTGRTGGYGIRANSIDGELRTAPRTTSNTAILGVGIKPVTTGSASFIRLYDGTNLGLDFAFNATTGEITAYRSATALGTTTGAGLANGSWAYVEIKAVCDSLAGAVTIKVNGVSKLVLSGVNTQVGSHAYWDILAIRTTNYCYHDDLYWCDNTGTVNNDWVGVRKVMPLFPNGDSATVQWTPSAVGAHWSLVDEAQDNTADYVEDGTVGHTELWDYQDISNIGSINGIQINTSCFETNAQSFSLLAPVLSGGVQNDGTSQGVNCASIKHKVRIMEKDPATGGLWSIDALNAAKIGVKVA